MNENEMVKARWSHLRAAYKADLPALTVARARELLREYPDCGPAWKVLGEALARIIHEFLSWSTQGLYPQPLVVDLTQTMTQLNSDRSLGTASTYDTSDNCRE